MPCRLQTVFLGHPCPLGPGCTAIFSTDATMGFDDVVMIAARVLGQSVHVPGQQNGAVEVAEYGVVWDTPTGEARPRKLVHVVRQGAAMAQPRQHFHGWKVVRAGTQRASPKVVARACTWIRSVSTVVGAVSVGNDPAERNEIPDADTRHDAELQVQAFVFHVFGAADNLAWIWVSEKNVRDNDRPLSNGSIGIRKEKVRASFTPEFRAYIDQLKPWFDYLESFRHALAHRIPLYIPPCIVTHANEAAYRELAQRMSEASACFNFGEYRRLKAEQRGLTAFRPWMQHSFIKEAHPVVFHSQMLADFNTIDEMASKMLDELAG